MRLPLYSLAARHVFEASQRGNRSSTSKRSRICVHLINRLRSDCNLAKVPLRSYSSWRRLSQSSAEVLGLGGAKVDRGERKWVRAVQDRKITGVEIKRGTVNVASARTCLRLGFSPYFLIAILVQ